MNTAQRSILQEKAKGTYDRNEYIRFLYATIGNCASLGRQFGLSRWVIRKIVMRRNDEATIH